MKKKILLTLFITVVIAYVLWPEPVPTVAVSSVYNVAEPGVTFQVNITVTDVPNLFMWAINMSWDPNIIEITTGDRNGLRKGRTYYNIYEGPFLKDINTTIFMVTKIDNTNGKMRGLACTFATSGHNASGSGVLATINFTSLSTATTTLDINGPSTLYPGHSVLIDHTGKEMDHKDLNGMFTEHGAPPIWMEPWFLATTVGIVLIVAAVYVLIKKKAIQRLTKRKVVGPIYID